MATWPASLPQMPLRRGYQEKPRPQAVRTEMDVGAPKMRRRYTGVITDVQCAWYMSETQVSTLETFFDTTLVGGSLSFDFTHPRKKTTVTARFVEPYTTELADGGDNDHKYLVSAKLEILP